MAHMDKQHAITQRRTVMQHIVKQSTNISPKFTQVVTFKTNNDKDSMLKDDQYNIQAKASTCQVKRYTTMNLCMRGDQNKHGKIRVTMLSKAK